MAFRFVALFALVAAASAVPVFLNQAYSDATAVSFSSLSSPTDAHAAPAKAPAYAPAPSYAHAPVQAFAPAFVHSVPTAVRVAAPAYKLAPAHQHAAAEEYTPAHYAFAYEVNDAHTGDVHGQQESREGDVVKGSYSLIEADGSRRIVEYTVDAHSGFNAVVHKENAAPHAAHAYAAPTRAAHAYSVPTQTAHAYAAPALSAPFAGKAAYSAAPVVSYSSVSAPTAHGAAAPASYYH